MINVPSAKKCELKANKNKHCLGDCDPRSVGIDNNGKHVVYCFGACGRRLSKSK
jgi:uncharacterized ParB-like nuclease family protein